MKQFLAASLPIASIGVMSSAAIAAATPVTNPATTIQPLVAQSGEIQKAEIKLAEKTAEKTAAKSSVIKQIELLPVRSSQAPADGRSTIEFAGRLLDASGQVVPRRVLVTLTSSAGKFVGVDQDTDLPGFQAIAVRGQFSAQLQSGLEAQKVRVRAAIAKEIAEPNAEETEKETEARVIKPLAPDASGQPTALQPRTQNAPNPVIAASAQFEDVSTYTQVEFVPHLRSPIVSGMINIRIGASGTDYFGSYRDFLNPDRLAEGTRLDVDAAVFASGRVGEWLITGALNNQRPLNETCDGGSRLFRDTQNCDQVYPVYGDSSTVEYLSPSIDSVYLKAERQSPVKDAGTDYAMWGDYKSSEFATASQFYSATDRNLHGLKANYNFGNLQATLMYGDRLQSFRRDAIAPDGTSGYYFVSQRLLVPGSETVFLETEELNRPGTVIERKTLNRVSDYEIDYDRGSILFRRPMQRTEFDLFGRTLVRRIVVTYQSDAQGQDATLYAGRLRYHINRGLGQESWLGASYLKENQGIRSFDLLGIDGMVSLGSSGSLIAEYARSSNDNLYLGNTTGQAYRIELNGNFGPGAIARAYYRSVDAGFANNATVSFAPGQTRYGVEGNVALAKQTTLRASIDREENYGIASANRSVFGFDSLFNPRPDPIPGARVDNSLTTLRAGLIQKIGSADLALDYVNRNRSDRTAAGLLGGSSSQLVSSLSLPIVKRLTFRAQNELSLGGSDPLYPNRTTVGLAWDVMQGVKIQLAHQFYSGGALNPGSVTSLDTLVDHRLSEDTSLTGRYSLLNGANGLSSQGAMGLNHRMTIAPGLRLSLGYERIFGDLYTYTGAGQQILQPYAVGQSGASLASNSGDSYSIGFDYTDNPEFKASAKLEHRSSSLGGNTVFSAAANGKISRSLTTLFRYQQANASNIIGLQDTANLKLGIAFRNPQSDQFNALFRYEYRKNPGLIPDSLLFGAGVGSNVHLLSAEAIYAPNWRWEFYGKVGMRNTESYLTNNLVNANNILLGQFRTTYNLSDRWDIVGALRWIGQSTTGFSELGYALEAGYYLTPNLRVGAGYSFGRANDPDVGDRSRGGLYVGLQFKLNELFDGFGLQKVAPPQQEESKVQPIAQVEVK